MLRLLLAAAAAVALVTPAVAETNIVIDNRGSQVLVAVNSFPIGTDGEVIDDNIGSLDDGDVPPGASATIRHSGDCGLVEMYFRYAGQPDGEEDQKFRVDTCQSRRFVLSDLSK